MAQMPVVASAAFGRIGPATPGYGRYRAYLKRMIDDAFACFLTL
jgi:hypothetical protein